MILHNLDAITSQVHKHAKSILTAFPQIYPSYSKGVHFAVTRGDNPDGSNVGLEIFCTCSPGFRYETYANLQSSGYEFLKPVSGGVRTLIFDFSGNTPVYYYFSERDNPYAIKEFPPPGQVNKRDLGFLLNVDLSAMATKYNGGRKALSAKGGKMRKGKPSNNKGKTNTRANSIWVQFDLMTVKGWDSRVITLVEAYKIMTGWGYKGTYKALSVAFKRSGKIELSENGKHFFELRITAISDDNSLAKPGTCSQLTLNNNIYKEICEENNENLNSNCLLSLTGNKSPEATPNENINQHLFPENFKEVKTQKRQLKMSDSEYKELMGK